MNYSKDFHRLLVQEYIETGHSYKTIAARHGVDSRTVSYWVERFQMYGALAFNVYPTDLELKEAVETDPALLTDYVYWTAKNLAHYFKSQGKKCSASYVLVHLRRLYPKRTYLSTSYWGVASLSRYSKPKF